jgi:cysteinyl-tRNA synthetase
MEDDFNTPIALSVLFDLAHEVQRLRNKDLVAAAAYGALLRHLGGVLGILQSDPEVFFQVNTKVESEKISALIAARQQARYDKNWAEADRIRDELAALDIAIEDGPDGTTWKSVK